MYSYHQSRSLLKCKNTLTLVILLPKDILLHFPTMSHLHCHVIGHSIVDLIENLASELTASFQCVSLSLGMNMSGAPAALQPRSNFSARLLIYMTGEE